MSERIATCSNCGRPFWNDLVCPACSLQLASGGDGGDLPDEEEIGAMVPEWEVLEWHDRDRVAVEAVVKHRQTGLTGILRFCRTVGDEAERRGKVEGSHGEHPNLLKVIEAVSEQGYRYEIFDFFDGVRLPEAVRRGSVSRQQMVAKVIPQLRSLCVFAGGNGLPTGIAPGDVWINGDGEVKAVLGGRPAGGGGDVLEWVKNLEKVGGRIGDYELLGLLGEGGFAEVYRAEQRGAIRREVALKILKPGMDSSEVLGRFEAERQALAKLSSPWIATIFDAGTTGDGRPYFVMELVEGDSYSRYFQKHETGLNDKLDVFLKICMAVQHAHEQGIVHRDLKPGNILITGGDDGGMVPKIIDFGIAKATADPLTQRTLHTRFYHLVGSLGYMSPEQAAMRQDVDERADVYALGCILYELLAGRTALGGKVGEMAPVDVLNRIWSELPLPPSKVAPPGKRISRDLDAVVMKAVEKEPGRRYASVSEMGDDIGRVIAGEAVSVRAPGVGYRLRRWGQDRRVRAGIFAGLGAACAAGVALLLWPEGAAESSAPEPIEFVAKSRTGDGRVVPVGLWHFDGDFENAIEGGGAMRVVGKPIVEFQQAEIGGGVEEVLSFPHFNIDEYLTVDNPIGPNGWEFATDTNEYTMVMDVMFPDFPRAVALLQASVGNSGGGEIFITKQRYLHGRKPGRFGNRVEAGRWVRLAATVGVRGTTQILGLWMDGQNVGPRIAEGRVDSHVGLNEEVHFFADGNGQTCAGFVNSIALYDVVLSEGEVAALGGASVGGIPASIEEDERVGELPEAVRLADAVLVPPEPGRKTPTYEIRFAGERLMVSTATFSSHAGGVWGYLPGGREPSGWELESGIVPSEAMKADWEFGWQGAADGEWVVVAAQSESVGGNGYAGRVYLYRKSGQGQGEWVIAQTLVSEADEPSYYFGNTIHSGAGVLAISEFLKEDESEVRVSVYELETDEDGEEQWRCTGTIDRASKSHGTVAVFADEKTMFLKTGFGRLELFEKEGGEWVQSYEVTPDGDVAQFARAMACDGETLLVGWPKGQSGGRGEVQVYGRDVGGEGAWEFSGTIRATERSSVPSHFGSRVAVLGSRAVVSGLEAGRKSVVVQQFERSGDGGASWVETTMPLVVPGVDGHALHPQFMAATTPYEGGRVLVYDLEARLETSALSRPKRVAVLRGSKSGKDAHFGYGFDRDGDQAIIGAEGEGAEGEASAGGAYVFARDGDGAWGERQRLEPSDVERIGLSRFGNDVSIDGEFAVVAASNAKNGEGVESGAAYVFHQSDVGEPWREVVKLESGQPVEGGAFGNSVDVDGGTIAVGAAYEGAGSVTVFELGDGGPGDWRESARLKPEIGEESEAHFGVSLKLDGNRLLVGGRNPGGVGFAELFERSERGAEWERVAVILPPVKRLHAQFGYRVEMDGETIAIGARSDVVEGKPAAGMVYVYQRGGDGWELIKTLASAAPQRNQLFTYCQLYGDLLFVGERGNGEYPGGCYVYSRNLGGAENWGMVHRFEAEKRGYGHFGRWVGYDGSTLLICEPLGGGGSVGRVYVYEGCRFLEEGAETASAATLRGSGSRASDSFGYAIDMAGKEAVIGAWNERGEGMPKQAGAVYFFREDGGGRWGEMQRVSASDATATGSARFGCQVALSGDVAVIGARHARSGRGREQVGAAYVYERGGAGFWDEVTKLEPEESEHRAVFGTAVDVAGTTLVVGAPHEGEGAVYVYERGDGSEGEWRFVEKLEGAEERANFGSSVCLSGNRLLVGCRQPGVGAGFAELFERPKPGGVWRRIARFDPPDGRVGDEFGYCVWLDGGTVVVGSLNRMVGTLDGAGAVDLFEASSEGWEFRKRIVCPEPEQGQRFGFCRLFGDRLFIGERGGLGGCYWFERNLGGDGEWGFSGWFEGTKMGGYAGRGIGFNGETLLVGESLAGEDLRGKVHVIRLGDREGEGRGGNR